MFTINYFIRIIFCLSFMCVLTQANAFQSVNKNQIKKKYPETYNEAVEFIYRSHLKDTLAKIKNRPIYLTGSVVRNNWSVFNIYQ
jgi:hypothetical protein